MLLPLTLGLLLVVLTAWFGPRRLGRLAALRFRGGWLVLLAATVQSLAMVFLQQRLVPVLITALLLAYFCWLNRRVVGIGLAACGIVLNMAVMSANGGAMPIPPQSVEQLGLELSVGTNLQLQKSRVLADETARLALLGDRLHLPGALGGIAAWSAGDLLLIAGIATILATTMKGPVRYGA